VLTLTVMVEGAVAGLREAASQLPPAVVLGVAARVSPLEVVMVQASAAGALPPMVKAKLRAAGAQTAVMVGCAETVNVTGTLTVAAPGALTAIEPL